MVLLVTWCYLAMPPSIPTSPLQCLRSYKVAVGHELFRCLWRLRHVGVRQKNAESSMDWFNRISAGTDRWSLPFNTGFSCHFCPSSDSWKREKMKKTHDSLSLLEEWFHLNLHIFTWRGQVFRQWNTPFCDLKFGNANSWSSLPAVNSPSTLTQLQPG